MTSLMDDLCGHICFVSAISPWCGATVQVNCKLTKPVRVGDVLRVDGRVARREDEPELFERAPEGVRKRLDRDGDGVPCPGLPHTTDRERYRFKKRAEASSSSVT